MDELLKLMLVAATPGGVERQEAAGSADLVRASDRLPIKMNVSREAMAAAWGVQFHEDVDELFVKVTLPAGWSIQADNSYCSDLVDSSGAVRARVFYKAAFYDRRADLSVRRRYHVDADDLIGLDVVGVFDRKTGARVFRAGVARRHDNPAWLALDELANAWLAKHYPDHDDPFAYWDEV